MYARRLRVYKNKFNDSEGLDKDWLEMIKRVGIVSKESPVTFALISALLMGKLGRQIDELRRGCAAEDEKQVFKAINDLIESVPAEADSRSMLQNCIGYCYYFGLGVEPDAELAVTWYRRALQGYDDWYWSKPIQKCTVAWQKVKGWALARYNLGICYHYGIGVTKKIGEAVYLYRMPAEVGIAPAQFKLGYCYLCGHGIDRDRRLAVKCFQAAANQNYAPAQYHLGRCYQKGFELDPNPIRAINLYCDAIAGGYRCHDAENDLGELLVQFVTTCGDLQFIGDLQDLLCFISRHVYGATSVAKLTSIAHRKTLLKNLCPGSACFKQLGRVPN